jgi:adenylate kinase
MTDSLALRVGACAVADTIDAMSLVLVLIGPQGAGKGTQAQMLAARLKLPVIATGDILREVARTDTELGRQVREVQAAGKLVSDEILGGIVSQRLCKDDCKNGCILDGFPRTLPQAQLLEKIAADCGNRIIAIKIDVPSELLHKRLAGRRICTGCGATYNIYFKPPKHEGVCDLDGQPLYTRSDDNEEAIQQRLSLYDEKTRPLLDYYRGSGRLLVVNGAGAPEEVFNAVLSAVEPHLIA